MDQENYEYLTERLKYAGFEDKLNAELKKEIEKGKETVDLKTTLDVEGKKMDVDLSFKRSTISDRYYFNKFTASLNDEHPELGVRTHTYYQNQGVTAKEAFNLLEGRAVFKSLSDSEKEPYKAWLQLDLSKKDENNRFKVNQYHENYGFKLEETLRKFPIKELQDETKTEWMLRSLQKGNTYPVAIDRQGMEEVMFIEASPKFKSINVYDSQMNLVKNADLLGKEVKNSPIEGLAQEDSKKQNQMQSKKQKLDFGADGASGEQTQRKSRKRPRI